MTESSNNNRSVLGGLDKEYSRSVLGRSDVKYRRSVMSGSDEYGGSDVDYSRTIISGSDEVIENQCEPCQNDGKSTTAVKYCTDCSENLCGQCSKNHTKFKSFRHHVLRDAEAVKPVINEDRTKIIDKPTDRRAKLDITSEQVQQIPGHMTPSPGAIRNVTSNLVSTIDVSTRKDKMSPYTCDLAMVQTHYCVVTDRENKSVKVVDTRTRCVTSQIQIRDAEDGWRITSVNDDQVAVSIKNKDVRKFLFFTNKGVWKILLFSVSASGIISDTHKSIKVESPFIGITHCNDRFYATFIGQLDVISMQGQIITTFTNKSFGCLADIVRSNDHNTLYVCDWIYDTVFSVDLNGNVTASYKDNDLKKPEGITVDSDGYIYVCSRGTRCVHQLTADLNKVQVIIKDVDVWRCVFNKNDNSLNLGRGNEIKVYNLT